MADKENDGIYWYLGFVTLFLTGFCYLNLLLGVSNATKYNPPMRRPMVAKTVVVDATATTRDHSYVSKLDIQNFVTTLQTR